MPRRLCSNFCLEALHSGLGSAMQTVAGSVVLGQSSWLLVGCQLGFRVYTLCKPTVVFASDLITLLTMWQATQQILIASTVLGVPLVV